MLKHLFTSKARVKLLTIFLLKPDEEYFVRELTRELDEQINSVRRELDNLKKMGLLKSRAKNRHKFYSVNKDFVLFNELRRIIIKANPSIDAVIKNIQKMGQLDFLLVSGVFLEKESPVDLLISGDINKEQLEKYLDTLENQAPIKFSVLKSDDFLYRLKCQDKFILSLVEDRDNMIAINKLTSGQ
ncbi:winged helix-turn-helix transcriptional regulator [Candidatus Peregrinibacteria bacterium]|nr:MAG: winged helix-turn-helix transcriptional regulator [Candidatus Peregrinibacteria bacterium]